MSPIEQIKAGTNMKVKQIEYLFYNDGSQFDHHIRKARKAIDFKAFEALPSIADKASYLKKNGPLLAPKLTRIEKSLEKAMKYKEEGNKLFKEGKPIEAMDLYTKALQYCPCDENEPGKNKEYAILWANRSAALDQAGLYEATIRDIDLAFKYGYPRELYFKVYNRKGHALFKRKQFEESKATFKKCQDFIGKSEMNTQERERWRIRMAKQMSVFNASKKGIENKDLPLRPWAQQIQNESSIELDEKAKAVKAKRDVNVQEIIHNELPFAAVVMEGGQSEGKMCPHSLSRMSGGIPCSFGSPMLFKTEKDRDEANQTYQQHEFKATETWKELGLSAHAKLAFRIFTTLPRERIEEISKNVASKNFTCEAEEVLGLPVGQPSNSDMLSLTCLVNFMLRLLDEHGYFANSKVNQDDVTKLLFRSLLIVAKYATNVFLCDPPYNESDLWNMKQFPTKDFALALYPKFAKLMSCSTTSENGADVTIFFQDSRLMVQCLRKLKAGQKVDIHWDKAEGKIDEALADIVNFKCAGKTCELSFPLHEKTKEQVIKCPLEQCGAETNIWKRLKRIVELKNDHKSARKSVESKNFGSGINYFVDLIEELETFVYRPYKEITSLESDLRKSILLNNEIMERQWLSETR